MRYLMPVLFAAGAMILSSGSAYAECGDQLKLLPTDGAELDVFGWSVAVSGSIAIVGAYQHADNGEFSGAAYLFDTTTGQQIEKILPSDGTAGDRFGWSVAISGNIAIVGAPLNDFAGLDSGSAYLFDISDPMNPVQIDKVLPLDGAARNHFGFSVAIDDSIAIVGARRDDDNGGESGSAYLFASNTGQQLFKLLPLDGMFGDEFGISVGVSGDTAIVGSHQDDDNGNFSGSAYLFDTTTGLQVDKLLPEDGQTSDLFGRSVSISGATAIVGAHNRGGNGGTAYLFDINTGEQLFQLFAGDQTGTEVFGWSVAISGVTAIVSAHGDIENGGHAGAAYLFDTATGQQTFKLLAEDGEEDDWFGTSVAIDDSTAIVGAYLDDDNGNNSGSAYLFDPDCPVPCSADLNGDGQTDLGDFAFFFGCVTGPGQPVAPGCEPADMDGDGDVDMDDFGLFQIVFGGGCP
jgi:hypothetical protein